MRGRRARRRPRWRSSSSTAAGSGRTSAGRIAARRWRGASPRVRPPTAAIGQCRRGSGCSRTTASRRPETAGPGSSGSPTGQGRSRSWSSGRTGRIAGSTISTAGSRTAKEGSTASGRPASECRSTPMVATCSSTRSGARTGRAGSGRTASSPTSRRAASATASTRTAGIPSAAARRYRATVIGPGVTPDVMWEGPAPGAYDPARDAEANAAQRALLGPDPLCKVN